MGGENLDSNLQSGKWWRVGQTAPAISHVRQSGKIGVADAVITII